MDHVHLHGTHVDPLATPALAPRCAHRVGSGPQVGRRGVVGHRHAHPHLGRTELAHERGGAADVVAIRMCDDEVVEAP